MVSALDLERRGPDAAQVDGPNGIGLKDTGWRGGEGEAAVDARALRRRILVQLPRVTGAGRSERCFARGARGGDGAVRGCDAHGLEVLLSEGAGQLGHLTRHDVVAGLAIRTRAHADGQCIVIDRGNIAAMRCPAALAAL